MLHATACLLSAILAFTAAPEPPGALALERLERETELGQPFVVAGERALVVGSEAGEFEVWIWPFKVADRIRPWIRLSGEEPLPLDEHLIAFALRPDSATALYRLPTGEEVAMHVFVPATRRAVGLVFEAPDLQQHAVIELHLAPSLRMVWPATSDGISPYMQVLGEEAVVIRNVVSSGPRVFAAVTGTHPLRERVLPAGGASIAEPMPPGETVVVGFGLDEQGWERAADQAREVVRHYAFEMKAAGERYRDAAAGCTLQTGDPTLDSAFAWSKLGLVRAQMRSQDNASFLATGYGPAAGGSAPGPAWTTLETMRHAARLAAPVGMADPLVQALDEITRRDLRPTAGPRLIPGLLSLSDRSLKEPTYRYESADSPAYLLLALAEIVRWTGDDRLLRKHVALLDDALAEWTPDALAGGDALRRTALWWEASDAAAVALSSADRTSPNLESLHGARADLAGRLTGAWDADLGWFLSDGEPAPVTSEGMRFAAGDAERAEACARFLEQQGLVTPWGVRTLAPRSSGYLPQQRGQGAVDPLLTAEVANALRHAAPPLASELLASNAGLLAQLCLGGVPSAMRSDELLAVGHPHDTARTAMVGASLLEALLGLEPNGAEGRLVVAPLASGRTRTVALEGLRIGRGQVGLRLSPTGQLDVRYEGPGELRVVLRAGGAEHEGTVRRAEDLRLGR